MWRVRTHALDGIHQVRPAADAVLLSQPCMRRVREGIPVRAATGRSEKDAEMTRRRWIYPSDGSAPFEASNDYVPAPRGPMVFGDLPSYQSPIDNRWIDG